MRLCLEPRCRTPVTQGRCAAHTTPAWSSASGPRQRIRGHRLQQLRRDLFTREPWCRICKGLGRRTLATIRDHIIPLAEGGQDIEENTQPICQACSDAKTSKEKHRGKRRAAP